MTVQTCSSRGKGRRWPDPVAALKISGSVLLAIVLLARPAPTTADPYPERSAGLWLQTADGAARAPALLLNSDYRVRVGAMLAETELSQSFKNTQTEAVEGLYVFPLPEDAAVHAMDMRIGERVIEGRIRERQAAREAYDQARSQGRRAALVDQERPNLFTTRVANILPGDTVEVRLRYQQPVAYRDGRFELAVPMTLTPRYIPGAPLPREPLHLAEGHSPNHSWEGGWARPTDQVPDADRITPPMLTAADEQSHRATVNLTLNAGLPLATVESPSHAINPTWNGDRVEIDLGGNGTPMDRDLILNWAPIAGAAPSAALFHEEHGGEHYLMMMVLPPTQPQTASLPRELIFVLDRSGSMAGEPFRQAKAALLRGLESLKPEDRFNLISFSDQTGSLFRQAEAADSGNLARARAHLDALEANGGTEMAAALAWAMTTDEDRASPGAVRQILFITDGAVGNEAALLDQIHQGLGDSRLFMVGIGSAPNRHFLRKAAQFGRGSATVINDTAAVKTAMDRQLTRMESPMLADIALDWQGSTAAVHSQRPGDLYRGEPLILAARMEQPAGSVTVSGAGPDPSQPRWQTKLELENAVPAPGIHRYWARKRIETLLDSRLTGADPKAIEDAVLKTALAHDLASPYTSFLALEKNPARDSDAPLRIHAVPGLLPAGMEAATAVMPQTATPGPLRVALGLAGLILALVLLVLKRHESVLIPFRRSSWAA